jgi:hypothetical protein
MNPKKNANNAAPTFLGTGALILQFSATLRAKKLMARITNTMANFMNTLKKLER